MANLVIPNTFSANTLAESAEVNANFAAIETFVETDVIHRDASIAFTGVPSGPGTNPTTDNQFARKAYVDSTIEGAVPAGSIVHTVRASALTGWVFLDGSTITNGQSLYPDLWAVLPASMQSGSDIVLPDARRRILAGFDSTDTAHDVIGETGGAATVTLTTTQLPAHTHTGTTATDAHSHTPGSGSQFLNYTPFGGSLGIGAGGNAFPSSNTTDSDTHSHTFTTASSGSGAAFSILNPYITFNVMMRAY